MQFDSVRDVSLLSSLSLGLTQTPTHPQMEKETQHAPCEALDLI